MTTFFRRSGGARLSLADFITVDPSGAVDGIAYDFFERAGQILPVGIPSAEAFGALTLVRGQFIEPAGIPSAEAFGLPTLILAGSIYPAGIASAESFGTLMLVQQVAPAGIPSGESFGSLVLSYPQEILPAGIASGEAFGSLLLAELQQLQLAGIPSAEAFGDATLLERQRIAPSGIPSAEAFGSVFVGIIQAISPVGIPAPELTSVHYVLRAGLGLSPPTFSRWTVKVVLGGVDVSARITGQVSVDAEEGAARLADFTLEIAAGETILLPAYTGQAVTIDFAEAGSASLVRLFTGVVELPRYDFVSRTMALQCTDDLPGVVAGMARPDIDALIGGEYSAAVFSPTADQWQYARDRMTTVSGALDLSPAGVPRRSWWLAATSADYLFTAADLLYDATVEVDLANRSEIRNRILIDFSYRFPRCKRRSVPVAHTIDGVSGASWADFLSSGRWTLARSVVRDALSGIGWSVVGGDGGISFDAAPPSGIYQDALGAQLVWNNPAPETICLGFSAALTKSYAQVIEERYQVAVENAASVAALGALANTVQTSLEVDFDVSAWESASNAQPAGGGYAGDPAEPTLDMIASGELAVDYFPAAESNRAAANAAVSTLIAQAKTTIEASHRLNSVSFSAPLVPALDLIHTVEVATDLPGNDDTVPKIRARGKVRHVAHQMDLGSGQAVSVVTVAVCSLSGLGAEHPASLPVVPPPPAGVAIDPGAVLSCVVSYPNLPADDHALSITVPAIDATSRNHYSPTVEASYAARLVEDLFVITT